MPEARAPLHLVIRGAIAVMPALATIAACTDNTSGSPATSDPDAGAGTDSSLDGSDSVGRDSGEDANPKTTCSITRAYGEACGSANDLNCGRDGFDAWCEANDKALNSDAYRRAEALCLTEDNCDIDKRHDCEYEHFNDETPTTSQKALVTAYCEMCEPSDVSGCTMRSTTYDSAKGIDSIGDIFIAAWEIADGVVDEMKAKCTGAAVDDAGANITACAKAFGDCTADIYLARLPDCPK
jgi:hypothetical protein